MVPFFRRASDELPETDLFPDQGRISYTDFLPMFAEHALRESYRSLQKAAISLNRNLDDVSNHLLSVVQPELYQLLHRHAHDDARLAYWVFQSPPFIELDDSQNTLTLQLTVMDEPPGALLAKGALFPIEYKEATIVNLADTQSIAKGLGLIRSLRTSIEEAAESIATCIRQNWTMQELI